MSDSSTATDAGTTAHASTAAALPLPGTLTVRDTTLAPQTPLYPPGHGGGEDPLAGGIDYKRVWHAFRRRWLPAVVLGAVLGSVAAISTWLFMPRGFEAVAWLRVRDKSGMLTSGGRDGGEYEAYRKTQVTLIKSPYVLTSALRRPGVAELPTILEQGEDAVGWLSRAIQVAAPGESEVLQLRLRGEHPADMAKIVNAVMTSYLEGIVNKEREDNLGRRDSLEKKYKENMAEMRERRETFNSLARTLGTRDSSEVALQRSLLLDHLGTLRSQMLQSQRDLSAIDAELAVLDAQSRGELGAEDTLSEDVIESAVSRDPQITELGMRLASLEETILFQEQRSARGENEPAVKRLRQQRDRVAERIGERRAELRPQVVAQMAGQGSSVRTGQVVQSPPMLKMRREMISASVGEISKEFDKVAKEATELGKANADLEGRRSEIEHLQRVTDQIGIQLETSALDLSMPSRVTVIEEAGVPDGNDRLFRLMLSMLAGGAGLAIGGGSIVGFEYLRDRLATTDEVPRRLGVRILGALPRISRSRSNVDNGLLAECVDGIRTLVMQSGREAPRVILVTSAVEHEGKTTFSSQLAASLARSDKRTLLLDGDLRHPNVHVALELELGVGLSELLRGEITSDEAVQPTSIDGLFAVTGGNCDYAAVTALSRPELAKVIKSYRESFDHIVIDAGPVLAFADALLLGQQSDVAIVATMRDASRVPLVNSAIERLRAAGVRVLGVIMNGVSDSGPRRLYASPLPR